MTNRDIEKYRNARITYRPSNEEKRINDRKPKRHDKPIPWAEIIFFTMALLYFF